MIKAISVAAVLLGMPASAQVAIEEPIEPNGWGDGPRSVVLRCAGLIWVLLSVRETEDLDTAFGLLVMEAARLSSDDEEPRRVVVEVVPYREAYLALPQEPATQAIVASDMQSCTMLVGVLQGRLE